MSSTGYIIVSVVLFDDNGGVVNICFTGTCTVTLCMCVSKYSISMCYIRELDIIFPEFNEKPTMDNND